VFLELNRKADSLQIELRSKDLYITNIKNIFEGKDIVEEMPDPLATQYAEISELPFQRRFHTQG
jgi:hypothetical protein